MDVLYKTKKLLNTKETLHVSLHRPNIHSSSDTKLDLDDHPTLMLLGHEYYPFSVTLPVPFGSPALVDKSVLNGIDPAFNIVAEKYNYNVKYEAMLRKCHGVRLPQGVDSLPGTSVSPMIEVHPNLLSLAQLISQDPHPHFNGEYNSYYGNTVTICNVQGNDCVIYPSTYSLGKLKVVIPNYDSEPCTVGKEYLVDHGVNNPQQIYQIQSSGNMVLLRMSKKCILFELGLVDDEMVMQLLHSEEIKESFITACLNPYKNQFTTFTPDALVKVHDTTNAQINCEINLGFLECKEFWGSLHYEDENVLMFCDNKSIHLLDLRTSINRSSISSWDADSITESCDSIYSSTKGNFLHYVGTNHYLLSLDVRKGWCQRWTHGLTNIPSLLSLTSKEIRDDSLLIGCQVGGSIVNVFNAHSTDFNFEFVKTPPFQLPSLIETLHQARLEGQCLLPLLNSRVSMSLTGLSSIRKSCSVDVFMCNSVNDLFSQRIDLLNKPDSFTPKLSNYQIKCLSVWESECLQQHLKNESKIIATDIHPHQKYFKFFDDSHSSTDESDAEPIWVENKIQPWAWKKQNIESCCDVIASKLLPCWKLEEDDGGSYESFDAEPQKMLTDSDSESSDDSIVDVNQRIHEWLNQSVQGEANKTD